MSLFTSNYLKSVAQSNSLNESVRSFSVQKLSLEHEFDIFLSHSFLDREEVLGLFKELTEAGFSVYVDWIIDSELDRNNVTKATAELIRNRMKNSKSLLLAISTNATMSKWMPWELGYVDGSTNKCAIVPVSTDNLSLESFERAEYLKLYPYLDREYDTMSVMRLWINDDPKTYVTIEGWINGINPIKRN